jgi:hypothetical protein
LGGLSENPSHGSVGPPWRRGHTMVAPRPPKSVLHMLG